MKNDETATGALLLRGASAVLPQGIVEDVSLLIEHGCIKRILKRTDDNWSINSSSLLELDGLTLFPGFIDVHIHGSVGVDTMEATTDDLHRMAQFLAGHGVTAWLPTLVPAPEADYERAVRAIEGLMREQSRRPAAARALGLHYEGPFVNSAQCGALRPAYFRTFTGPTGIDALATLNEPGAVQVMTVAPEIDGGVELVRELTGRGWVVSIGHTRATVEVLDRACEAGAHHMTHFMNAMLPLHHRTPGPIGWGLLRDDVTCDIIADGIHLDPLMLRLLLKCKTAERLNLISDAVAPAGLGDGEYRIWGETITVTNGRTSNEKGSIAGSVINMHDAVRLMLSLGVPAKDVARLSATNSARLLNVDQSCGSIEEGKRADLVALDQQGNVKLTLVGGRVAFENSLKSGIRSPV